MSISTSDTTSASTRGATGGATQTAPAAEAAVVAMPFAKALNAGLRAAMAADDHVLMMGEDIGKLGGVFRVTEGLQAEFGDRRVLDTPLAESGIVGTAIGLAMAGFRPVVEIQFDGFVFPVELDLDDGAEARHREADRGADAVSYTHLTLPTIYSV